MAYYRRAKVALDAFRNLSSKWIPKSPIQESCSRIYSNGSTNSVKFSSGFYSYSCISQRLRSNSFCNPNFNADKRYFCVHRYHRFRPRGPIEWLQNPPNVPYTKRTRFLLFSKEVEKLGEWVFELEKADWEILPAIHPDSVRVRLISNNIIEALQRGLKHETLWSDMGYASMEESDLGEEGRAHDTLRALSENVEGKKIEGNWRHEDQILDDKWVQQQSRKKGQEKGLQPATSHLDGLNWEVLVVNEPDVDAACLPGGKIMVSTKLLEHFSSDAEIAIIIGHEVAHVVARHAAETITKKLWFAILQLILYLFYWPAGVGMTILTFFLKLPISRKMEMEADYIGLLLMASAGYDPRLAPEFYEKMGEFSGDCELDDYLSAHPSGKKRAQMLAQARVMEEALIIYRETRN